MTANLQLRQLLEKSRNIANTVSAKNDLPHIERNLEEIESQSRKFASKITKPGESPEKKAPFFLAKVGIDGDKLSQTVRSINVLGTFEPRELIAEADVSNHVLYKHRSTVTTIIQDGHNQTIKDYHEDFERSLSMDWERTKYRVFEELGQHKAIDTSSGRKDDQSSIIASASTPYRTGILSGVESTATPMSVAGTPFRPDIMGSSRTPAPRTPAIPGSRIQTTPTPKPETIIQLTLKMNNYSEVVTKLNESRAYHTDFGIINVFQGTARKNNIDKGSKSILDCWQALAQIVGEENVLNGFFQRNPLKGGQYARIYQNPLDPRFNNLQIRLLSGARKYLEDQYCQYMEELIAGNRKEAQIGGVPSIKRAAQAVMRIVHRTNGGKPTEHLETTPDNDKIPIWGVIFILTRGGHLNDALETAREYERHLHRNDRSFLKYFADYVARSRRLSREQREHLVAEVKQRRKLATKHPQDYYKMAMYHILAQIEQVGLPETAISSSEDHIWYQLMIVQQDNADTGPENESYFVHNFQKKILDFGPNSYSPDGKDPVLYFKVLLLSGQFERAVDYLYKTVYSVEAVHFGIALAYYGLLRVPDNQKAVAMLVEEGDGVNAALNFNSLMTQHSNKLSAKHPTLALQYLLCMYFYVDEETDKGRRQLDLCHDCVRQLVYDTGAFTELLGDLRQNSGGEIVRYLRLMFINDETEYKSNIIKPLGQQFKNDGRFKEALRLFEISRDYDDLISVLNKMLGEYIWLHSHHQALQETEEELDPSFIRQKYFQYQRDHSLYHSVTALIDECEILLQLTDFIKLVNEKEYIRALGYIEKMGIIPLDGDMTAIAKRNQEIYTPSQEIHRNLPDIMLLTMECIYEYHKQLRTRPSPGALFMDIDNYSKLEKLQKQAKNLLTLAGMSRLNVPKDTHTRMTHYESLMN